VGNAPRSIRTKITIRMVPSISMLLYPKKSQAENRRKQKSRRRRSGRRGP
jgi:hypothetical protein